AAPSPSIVRPWASSPPASASKRAYLHPYDLRAVVLWVYFSRIRRGQRCGVVTCRMGLFLLGRNNVHQYLSILYFGLNSRQRLVGERRVWGRIALLGKPSTMAGAVKGMVAIVPEQQTSHMSAGTGQRRESCRGMANKADNKVGLKSLDLAHGNAVCSGHRNP